MSMMQATITKSGPVEIYEMTEGDVARMRRIARRQIHGSPAIKKPVRDVEAELIKAMSKAEKKAASIDLEAKPARAERLRAEDIAARLRAAIGEPKTAHEIAKETCVPRPTVMTCLRKMALDGLVEATSQGHTKGGQPKPFLYAAPGTFRKPIDFSKRKQSLKKPDLRAIVLKALSEPRAPFQVADLLGIGRAAARYQVSRLAEAGLIRKHGRVDAWRTKGVDTWVRA